MILILVLERLSITPLLSVSTASLVPSLILSASVSFMYFCHFFVPLCLFLWFWIDWGTVKRHTNNNAEPCGLHCVNWLELVLFCLRVVFDVNMSEAWLSFVVIRLKAQKENSCWEQEKERGVCMCITKSKRGGRLEWGIRRIALGPA